MAYESTSVMLQIVNESEYGWKDWALNSKVYTDSGLVELDAALQQPAAWQKLLLWAGVGAAGEQAQELGRFAATQQRVQAESALQIAKVPTLQSSHRRIHTFFTACRSAVPLQPLGPNNVCTCLPHSEQWPSCALLGAHGKSCMPRGARPAVGAAEGQKRLALPSKAWARMEECAVKTLASVSRRCQYKDPQVEVAATEEKSIALAPIPRISF